MRTLALLVASALTAYLSLAWAQADEAKSKPAPAPAKEHHAHDAHGEEDEHEGSGSATYDRFCLACHGVKGNGQGPAAPWLWPKPRDFTLGEYKWRSTPSGQAPTEDDLRTVIRRGVPGTSMHAFGASLKREQVTELITVLRGFNAEAFQSAQAIQVPPPPAVNKALVDRGRTIYTKLGCQNCHGASGKGDGPSAAGLKTSDGRPAKPYDLTAKPIRRPREPGASPLVAIYKSLVTGLSGTPMPSYQGMVPDADLWAVAAFVDSIRLPDKQFKDSLWDRILTSDEAKAEDKKTRFTRAGYWPTADKEGHGDPEIWGRTLTLNSKPSPALAPAQRSLSAKQCARCHNKQYREWGGSLHAKAFSPGLLAQLLPMEAHRKGAPLESCQRCHAPLAEQQVAIRPAHSGGSEASRKYKKNPFYDAGLRHQGINCASCHVRNWERHGPPKNPGSSLLSQPGYPYEPVGIYERSDFCLGCHQLPPRQALNGKPLLNTYREWLEGPYMKRGIQCQHCHMPNREHQWKGVHDKDTFRQGFKLEAVAKRNDKGVVSVRARMKNVGAGHFLPTTPTPAAWLIVELVDKNNRPIDGARSEKRVGRHLAFKKGKFVELEDTRIPPGESIELAGAWKGGGVTKAKRVKISVRVAPDDYYEGLYRSRLKRKLPKKERRLFEEALRRGEAAHFVAAEEYLVIPKP